MSDSLKSKISTVHSKQSVRLSCLCAVVGGWWSVDLTKGIEEYSTQC